jgi:hypothetical protein
MDAHEEDQHCLAMQWWVASRIQLNSPIGGSCDSSLPSEVDWDGMGLVAAAGSTKLTG